MILWPKNSDLLAQTGASDDGFYIGTYPYLAHNNVVKTQKVALLRVMSSWAESPSGSLFTLRLVFSNQIFLVASVSARGGNQLANGAKSQRKTNHHIITVG